MSEVAVLYVSSFVDLVEREWLDGGHQFSIRHRPVLAAPEREQAPVFLLFLDAVWQVSVGCGRSEYYYEWVWWSDTSRSTSEGASLVFESGYRMVYMGILIV